MRNTVLYSVIRCALPAILTLLVPAVSSAQEVLEVKPQFAKLEEVKVVVWKASAALGFSLATGNANMLTLTGGADVSRNDGKNKVQMTVKGIYGLTTLPVLNDMNSGGMPCSDAGASQLGCNGTVDNDGELSSDRRTTAAFLEGKLRYDRFFTKHNMVYADVYVGLDRPASKRAYVGAQAGYGRQIVKTQMHELAGEAGYDFLYANYIAPDMVPPDFAENVILHSGRLFLGYKLSVNDHTTIEASVEALINFNPAHIGDRDVGVAEASRVNGLFAFTTKVWKPLSLRAATALRFNNAPGLNNQLKFAPDYPGRYNQKLDTLTDISLILSFI